MALLVPRSETAAAVAAGVAPTDEIEASARSLWASTVDAVPRVGVAIAIVLLGWALARGLRWGLRARLLRTRSPSFAHVMSKVASWMLVVVSVLLAVAVTFPSVKPVDLLSGLGFFSVAVGFAFQDILENTLAGVLLLFRQPFRSGDQITVAGRSGTVAEITIRETRLTTYDGETVLIPNRDVYKSAIAVHTDHQSHRLQIEIGVAYGTDVGSATTAVVEALLAVPGVHDQPPPEALVHEFGVSTLNITATLWTDARRLPSARVRDAAIRAIKARLDRDGVELPANVVDLHATPSLRAAWAAGAPGAAGTTDEEAQHDGSRRP